MPIITLNSINQFPHFNSRRSTSAAFSKIRTDYSPRRLGRHRDSIICPTFTQFCNKWEQNFTNASTNVSVDIGYEPCIRSFVNWGFAGSRIMSNIDLSIDDCDVICYTIFVLNSLSTIRKYFYSHSINESSSRQYAMNSPIEFICPVSEDFIEKNQFENKFRNKKIFNLSISKFLKLKDYLTIRNGESFINEINTLYMIQNERAIQCLTIRDELNIIQRDQRQLQSIYDLLRNRRIKPFNFSESVIAKEYFSRREDESAISGEYLSNMMRYYYMPEEIIDKMYEILKKENSR